MKLKVLELSNVHFTQTLICAWPIFLIMNKDLLIKLKVIGNIYDNMN